jgi:hypothetical protein
MATSVSAAILPNASYVMYRAVALEMHVATCVFVGGSSDAHVHGQNFGPLHLLGLSRETALTLGGFARALSKHANAPHMATSSRPQLQWHTGFS